MPVLDKLLRLFDALGRWKTSRKAFVLELLRVLYTDDNALFRQKSRHGVKWITPLLVPIIRQGIQEGVLTISSPEQVITFAGPASLEWFKNITSVANVTQGADEHTLQLNVQGALTEIIRIASDHHATNIATREPTLEEVFLRFYEPEQKSSALAG